MARINNLTNFLTDVASSIKVQTEDNTPIPASQFDTKILGIQKGKLSNEEYTKANNDLDNILSGSENVLPNEYQEVEYLISDGYEYIDTGYAFTNPELKIEVKYRKLSTLARNVFGVDLSKNPRKMHGNVFRNSLYVGNSAVINDVAQELGVDYTLKFEFKNNVAKWNINGNEYTYNGANSWEGVSDGETEYLFANRGTQSAQYLLIGRIYYAKFYDNNGDLVRNFIPCYRKSDDKPGMYDTVNNVFYTNEGTREFEVGEDIDVLNRKTEKILNEKTINLKPENIKSGVEILGVVGTYTGN